MGEAAETHLSVRECWMFQKGYLLFFVGNQFGAENVNWNGNCLEAKTMGSGGGNSIVAYCEFKLVCEKKRDLVFQMEGVLLCNQSR